MLLVAILLVGGWHVSALAITPSGGRPVLCALSSLRLPAPPPQLRARRLTLSLMEKRRGAWLGSSSRDGSSGGDGSSGRRKRSSSSSSKLPEAEPSAEGGLFAAGALASSAIIAEAIQIAGTAVLLYVAQQQTGTTSPVEAVGAMIQYIQDLGVAGYGVFAATMIFLQVVPIAAAFVLTVSAGAIFGAVKGTATVLTCSTISATISFAIARSFGRAGLLEAAQESKQFIAIDRAFASASFGTSLTLITLLRLSPVLPFAWANYVFGLSPVPIAAFSIGTFVGCFPAVTAYVSAGEVGADIAVNGAETDPLLLAVGAAATLGAISFAGNIATQALKDLDLDLEE